MRIISIFILVILIGLQGCVSNLQNIVRDKYNPASDPENAVIFGEIKHKYPFSFTVSLSILLKDLETGKAFAIPRGGFFSKDPFFAVKVKPGKYSIIRVNGSGGELSLWDADVKESIINVPEYTAVNIGTIKIKYINVGSSCATIRFSTELNSDELQNRFKTEYPNLNFNIVDNPIYLKFKNNLFSF